VYEIALLRLVNGQMVEGWFMMDEVGLLQQLGARLPARKDGRSIVPPLAAAGEDPDLLLRRLESQSPASPKDRNRIIAVHSKSSRPSDEGRAAGYSRLRAGFQHLHDYSIARGAAGRTLNEAFPDRQDKIDLIIAEGDQVWMRFNVSGKHQGNLFGIPPTGKQVGVPEVAIMRFENGKLKTSWFLGDELGLLLQLGVPNLLLDERG
jgi:SnoaL-like polyketide cyclase